MANKFGLDKNNFVVIDIINVGKTYSRQQLVNELLILIQYVAETIPAKAFAPLENLYKNTNTNFFTANSKDWVYKLIVQDIEENHDPHFPCYSLECDIQALNCNSDALEEAGCSEDAAETCQSEIKDKHSSILQLIKGTARNNPLANCENGLACKCKAGYFRSNMTGKCVLNKDCFGGCPAHSKYVKDLSVCEPSCDDPDASICRSNLGLAHDDAFILTDDKHVLPGCKCREGRVEHFSLVNSFL